MDKVLQKRKQGAPSNGQGMELLKMDLKDNTTIHGEE
jgi:hypothetical protein